MHNIEYTVSVQHNPVAMWFSNDMTHEKMHCNLHSSSGHFWSFTFLAPNFQSFPLLKYKTSINEKKLSFLLFLANTQLIFYVTKKFIPTTLNY